MISKLIKLAFYLSLTALVLVVAANMALLFLQDLLFRIPTVQP